MCLSTLYQQFSSDESGRPFYLQSAVESHHLIQIYREKVIQCLVLGGYTKCTPYTIETLLLYLHIEYFRSEDTQIGVWVLLGIVVRLALRMGYHRDASHSPRISPFAAEMRRRTWAVIAPLDVLTSAQVGLPRMIKGSHSDSAEPRNLLDEDFDESIVTLPLPRPDTDHTPIQYVVARNKLVTVFGMISDLTTSKTPSSYAEYMTLDKRLHETYQALPAGLQMTMSVTDGPVMIARRVFLVLLFHKAQCVLHRRYLLPARTDSRYTYSRTSCIEAALQILHYQSILKQESQPGGRFQRGRWTVSSIVKQEFLLAVTILCLDLDQDITAEWSSESQQQLPDTKLRERVIQALKGSYVIWLESSKSSREAQKAAEVLGIVLGKAQKMEQRRLGEFESTVIDISVTGSESNISSAGLFEAPLLLDNLVTNFARPCIFDSASVKFTNPYGDGRC